MAEKNRILSYCVAQKLVEEEISSVSGGGGGKQTKNMCASVTGAKKVQDWNADFNWDF